MRNQPRILFVSKTSEWTGPNNSLLLLLDYLRNSYHVSVLLRGEGLFSQRLACEDIPFFSFRSLDKWSIPSIYRLIRRERIDLVYGNSTHGSSRNALIASKLARVPFICHVREMGWGKSWRAFGYLKLANATIAVSRACAASIAKFTEQCSTHVVPNGTTVFPRISAQTEEREERTRLLNLAGLSYRDLIVTSVGNICFRKGQEHAVKAIAEVVEMLPLVRLVIIGNLDRDRGTGYVKKVRMMIQEAGLDDNVRLIGFQSDAARLNLGADIFLHTAISDPHPRAVIEAMSASLPVVAFDVDGVSETVTDGHTGNLVPKGDVAGLSKAIIELAENPTLRCQMGLEGRRRVEAHYAPKTAAERVSRIIDTHLHQDVSTRNVAHQ